ncbi:transglycosylase family protein [Streptomyces sp. NPDC047928]|uniref:transglycosylase family protein n=1 Tax=unclassified Streptomyces TaxID=2593676 RepID=UPI00370FB977
MRSGNGRHRRPRQAPALVVAAGVTGSAIALPLLGAGTASAVEGATWDRVAECESGGMWSADHGNGFYGGLQVSQETWEAYGGLSYAQRADLASRAQQITIAEKVYADRGAKAWETCAPIAGLTDGLPSSTGGSGADGASGSGAPDETGGSTGSPDPGASDTTVKPEGSGSSGTGGSGGTGGTSGGAGTGAGVDGSATGVPGIVDPETSASPEATPGAEQDGTSTGTGKHRGEPAKEEASAGPGAQVTDETIEGDNSSIERESGRHTSRGDGSARDASGLGPAGTYTVRAGDNLWAIADAHEVPGGWAALYDANRSTVGADPDLILPGQSLDLTGERG